MTVTRSQSDPQVILLPGLGADARLLQPQIQAMPFIQCPDWPSPEEGDGLPHFAVRCVEQWITGPKAIIDPSRPFYVGGVSFGGMVALEMARDLAIERLRPAGVLLIASCRSNAAVTDRFRRQQQMGSLAPSALLRWMLRGPVSSMFARSEGLDAEQTALLKAIAREVHLPFLHWAAAAVSRWELTPEEAAGVRFAVHQIHGEMDQVIPFRERDVTHTVPGGRHLIHLTHADAVNAWIRRCVGAA